MCYIRHMKEKWMEVPRREMNPSPVFSEELMMGILDTEPVLNQELLQTAAISRQPVSSLSSCLNFYTKDHLRELAQDHRVSVSSSLKKHEVVEQLTAHLVKQFPVMLPYLPRPNLEFLRLFKDETMLEIAGDALQYRDISHTHNFGFLYLFRTGETFTAVVPRELLSALEVFSDQNLWERVHLHQRIDAYAMALSNLYGVLDIDQYAIVWNRFESESLTPAMIMDELMELGRLQYYGWFDVELISSSYFQTEQEVVQFLETVREISYYIPSREDLVKYYQTPYDDQSPAASAMLEFLSGYLLPDGEQIEDLMDDISDTCLVGNSMQDVFNILNEYGLLFTGMDEISRFTELYAQLSEHSRKWELRGHMPVSLKKSRHPQS